MKGPFPPTPCRASRSGRGLPLWAPGGTWTVALRIEPWRGTETERTPGVTVLLHDPGAGALPPVGPLATASGMVSATAPVANPDNPRLISLLKGGLRMGGHACRHGGGEGPVACGA